MIAVDGTISTIAGSGVDGFSGDDGPAVAAQLRWPRGVAVSGGAVYIADTWNYRVRKVADDGKIATIAGDGANGFAGGHLGVIQGIAVDDTGNVYVTDVYNHVVRKIAPSGGVSTAVTTLAGNGSPSFAGDQSASTNAQLSFPRGIAADAFGNIYIADEEIIASAGSARMEKLRLLRAQGSPASLVTDCQPLRRN